MRSTGLSEFIEPCGTSAMPARRKARMPSSSRSASRVPANHTSPASIWPGGLIMRRIDEGQGRLAGAALARQPEPLARQQRKADIVDRPHLAARVVERDAQALDPQHRLAHALRRSRGLAISSSPTVRKNRPRKTVRMITVGAGHHHHQPLIIAALKLTQ